MTLKREDETEYCLGCVYWKSEYMYRFNCPHIYHCDRIKKATTLEEAFCKWDRNRLDNPKIGMVDDDVAYGWNSLFGNYDYSTFQNEFEKWLLDYCFKDVEVK